jgi:hypothetical protein
LPEWTGHHLPGSLDSDLIVRMDPAAGRAGTRIDSPGAGRVRDIREAAGGFCR